MSDDKIVNLEGSASGGLNASASISYVSGFPKKQLEFAKVARDRAGEIEAKFEGNTDKISQRKKREHQESVISAVANSIAFLDGQKYWFIYRIDEGKWDFEERKKIKKTGWKGIEDSFVKMAKQINGQSNILKDSKPYFEVKALREFRRDLLHFETPTVRAGKEEEEYNPDDLLSDQEFPENKLGTTNTYPFNWLTHEMAERSVRMSFTLWRFFGRELDKEDEFLKRVPRP